LMTFVNQLGISGVASFVAKCLALFPWLFLVPFLVRLHREMQRALSLLPRRTQKIRETRETGDYKD
jgi:hypothetical protein